MPQTQEELDLQGRLTELDRDITELQQVRLRLEATMSMAQAQVAGLLPSVSSAMQVPIVATGLSGAIIAPGQASAAAALERVVKAQLAYTDGLAQSLKALADTHLRVLQREQTKVRSKLAAIQRR
ncbi:MAG: hypothetical protein H6739_15745 [Alphaproteobacteria bacterium]|nr:hypothetical protein [Alphaproteobacteria bacterium]